MVIEWERVKDGEYNEHFANIMGHDVTIYSDRNGYEWNLSVDDSLPYTMEAKTLNEAKEEAEEAVSSE